MTKRDNINEALRLIRLYWGLSQKRLSEELGLSQSLISEIENGRKTVSLDVLEIYSEKLGIRLSQLLFFAETVEGQPASHKGKKFISESVLKILTAFSPADEDNAQAV